MNTSLILKALIIIHATGGTLALASGPVAMLTKKGSTPHRRAGRVYVCSMAVVFVTAVVVAYVKSLAFLFMIAFFSFYLVLAGYRALKLKKLHLGQQPTWIDWALQGGAGLFAIALAEWGIYTWLQGDTFGIVAIVFGAVLLWRTSHAALRFVHPPEDPKYWLYTHIAGMCAGYIATLTAFLVVNNHFLPGVVAWLLPTAVGTPLIIRAIRRVRNASAVNRPVVSELTSSPS
ncbi:DUF2306 domain-containing protein [Spirosoma validum]|uniref:DUF2306 domain-containing protein n=1 Tax=Spirosoma validum TaxID=2771355 RepID=A0A927B2J2_9BACT|nr:hypothetical protein [Spirosoma validum]MBD2754062.1 hypothetical protein [Spirosoma validum]